jgi:hypothetical protein
MAARACLYHVHEDHVASHESDSVLPQHRYQQLVEDMDDDDTSNISNLDLHRQLLALAKMQRSMHPLGAPGSSTDPLLLATAHINLATAYREAGYFNQVTFLADCLIWRFHDVTRIGQALVQCSSISIKSSIQCNQSNQSFNLALLTLWQQREAPNCPQTLTP